MRHSVRRLLWVAALALTISPTSHAAEVKHARIDTVEGAKTVLLQRGLSLRDAAPGEEIQEGERVRTDAKTTVQVVYPDGSRLTIHPGSDLEISKPDGGVQTNYLKSGLVQGQVQKAPVAEGGEEEGRVAQALPKIPTKPPIKFVIRTKTAVMGVRGTEFVAGFNAAQGLAQFNTLEGTVEVATGPSQLAGGQGVAVAGGHFVQATESGLTSVGTFESSSFVNGLSSYARSMSAGGDAPGGGSGGGSSSTAAQTEQPLAGPQAPPPVPPATPMPRAPQPLAPPPLPPALAEQKKLEAEQEKPHIHLLAFSLGGFFAQSPSAQATEGLSYYKALEACWTPIIPLPGLSFLYLRGAIGATFFENFSFSRALLVHEYQAFAGTTLLSPLFVEVGGGEQIWRNEDAASPNFGANAGLVLSPNGHLNRIYAGMSKFFKGTHPLEIHVGVVFVIW